MIEDSVQTPLRTRVYVAALCAVATVVFAAQMYLLWKPSSWQIEGDVLIHLVFARNMAQGHPFEYGYMQQSRAGTSPLWEGVLAVAGRASGCLNDPEAFLLLTRLTSLGFLLLFGLVFFVVLRSLDIKRVEATVVVMLSLANPIVFYWCIANPMETSLALLLVMLLCWGIIVADREDQHCHSVAWGAVFALLTLFMGMVRPEFVLLCGVAIVILGFTRRRGRWRLMVTYGLMACALMAILFGVMYWMGVSVVPNAAAARRVALWHFDSFALPLIGIRASPDACLLMLLFSPLLVLTVRKTIQPGRGAIYYIVTAWTVLMVAFFSFYYFTTWRGRYLLPVIMALTPVGVACFRRDGKTSPLRQGMIISWLFVAYLVPLVPLARHAQAVRDRAAVFSPAGEFIPKGNATLLVQEVQGVYYHPNLIVLSTDGLIDMKAYEAWKKNMSVYEFIMKEKPDLVGLGRYYLPDPDGFQEAIAKAAERGEDFRFKDVSLVYRGTIRGSGPTFSALYAEKDPLRP